MHVQICLHTQTQHEFFWQTAIAKLSPCKLSYSLLTEQKTSPAELPHADGNPELWKLQGGREMCLVQLLLVTGCSLSGSRHGCHCGSVLCCCVCVRKPFSSEPCDSEDVWGALRCPRFRNTATATMRPANYASSMQMSCRERRTETEKERKKQESGLRQRHNGICEGPVCAPLRLSLLFNCHVYPVTTSSVISTQCCVICAVKPPWGHYCWTGLSGGNWHILCGKSWYTPWSCFLCAFKQPWGQLIFDQSTSQRLLLLLMVWLHVTVYLMRPINAVL